MRSLVASMAAWVVAGAASGCAGSVQPGGPVVPPPSEMDAGQQSERPLVKVNSFRVGRAPSDLATADFDGDGTSDLVVSNREGGPQGSTVTLLLNAGRESRRFRRVEPDAFAGFHAMAVAAGDLDGDGRPDVAVANGNGRAVTVLRNRGGGVLGNGEAGARGGDSVELALDEIGAAIALADLNGDGSLDLIAGSDDRFLRTWFNRSIPGQLAFVPGQTFRNVEGAAAIAAGDINGDGRTDVVVATSRRQSVQTLLGLPGGMLGAPRFSLGRTRGPAKLGLRDLDEDGALDLLAADFGTVPAGEGGTVLWGDPAEPFATGVTLPSLGRRPGTGIVAADFAGDGVIDLAVAMGDAGTVVVVPRTQHERTLAAPITLPVSVGATGLVTGDFDGDGVPDLATTLGEWADLVTVIFNPLDVSR